ncbi:uncharacterized protein TNCV_3312011 [Trichonephila clavipes]|nr:uncharacterized protein TNCV_3312011 [Trichonephila clavipes]
MHLIENEAFNDSDIVNNLIDNEPNSLRADKMLVGIQLSNKFQKHFLKIDTNSERSWKFPKELRSCISGYRDFHKQLTNRTSSQILFTYFIVPKNKSVEIVSSILIRLTWENDILVLKPSLSLHNGNKVDDWMGLDEWNSWFESHKSETRTGAKKL